MKIVKFQTPIALLLALSILCGNIFFSHPNYADAATPSVYQGANSAVSLFFHVD